MTPLKALKITANTLLYPLLKDKSELSQMTDRVANNLIHYRLYEQYGERLLKPDEIAMGSKAAA